MVYNDWKRDTGDDSTILPNALETAWIWLCGLNLPLSVRCSVSLPSTEIGRLSGALQQFSRYFLAFSITEPELHANPKKVSDCSLRSLLTRCDRNSVAAWSNGAKPLATGIRTGKSQSLLWRFQDTRIGLGGGDKRHLDGREKEEDPHTTLAMDSLLPVVRGDGDAFMCSSR